MALNKYMHPRNIYKVPPDFFKLSKIYPEFAKIAKTELCGKVSINFKDPCSLRILTKCLLHHDFNLTVEIPEDRLVPTLPLRLNYILWIEDLMIAIEKNDNITGLDIGTGVCAIYPLLGAVRNKWHMIGTERDQTNFEVAQKNVALNNLQHLITISQNPTDTLVEYLFIKESNLKFDFCVCNPPFYSNLEELCESRSVARPEPKNCFTGSLQELITEGGELNFVRRLITESKVFKDKINIFTSMIGHKCNLKLLLQDLKTENITCTHTEFCQGRTTRWGLAWTFNSYNLQKLVPPRDKIRKRNVPLSYVLPELPDVSNNIETVFHKIKSILMDLNIKNKIISKKMHKMEINILALENTWSNQRRKRRLMKRNKELDTKKVKTCEDNDDKIPDKEITMNSQSNTAYIHNKYDVEQPSSNNINSYTKSDTDTIILHDNKEKQLSCIPDEDVMLKLEHNETNLNNNTRKQSPCKTSCTMTGCSTNKVEESNTHDISILHAETGITTLHNNKEIEQSSTHIMKANLDVKSIYEPMQPVVQGIMKLITVNSVITLELEFLAGSGGKESIHQILQYIKNNWK